MSSASYCVDCESPRSIHIQKWIDSFIATVMPADVPLPYSLDNALSKVLLQSLIALRIASLDDSYELSELSARLALFVKAARARGITCSVIKVGSRYTEYLMMEYQGRRYYFETYPTASHFNGPASRFATNKLLTKRHLLSGGLPTTRGAAYRFWQKERAVRESIHSIGFPLVVKPLKGTFSRHVTTDIRDEAALRGAIDHALAYQPSFLVEEYINTGLVHRVTVIDFRVVAVARQVPPNVVGNGKDTISQLIEKKNVDRRLNADLDHNTLLRQIPPASILKHDDMSRIVAEGEVILLHKDPFLRLGSDVIDETTRVDPENTVLCERIARHFDIRCAGIDIILEDCTRPWHEQRCAVLEINNLPNIEMHAADSNGNHRVSEALADMFINYYVRD